MRFHLDPDQELIRDSLRGSLSGVSHERRRWLEGTRPADDLCWATLMSTGVGAMLLPAKWGGSELGLLDAALAFELIGETATPGSFLGQVLAGLALTLGEDSGAREKWLSRLGDGSIVAATFIELPGTIDGLHYLDGTLTGEVPIIAGSATSDLVVVVLASGASVVVEAAAAGVELTPVQGIDPTRPIMAARFTSTAAHDIGLARPQAARLLDAALVLTAADALGGAQQCLDMSVEYARTREQFGQPIGAFQALKHQLAGLALRVEPSRALLWYAAHAWDQHQADASRVAALTKAHLTDNFVAVARGAIEAHGGIGYTWEYDLHIWFRRAIHDRAFLGSPTFHRERAVALADW